MVALATARESRGHTLRWSCGPADRALHDALQSSGARVWPDLDLPDFASALAACRLVVSPDTGVAHLSAWLGVPQVVTFGPTDPHRWRPLGRAVTVLRAPDLCGGAWGPLTDGEDAPHRLRRCRPPEAATCR